MADDPKPLTDAEQKAHAARLIEPDLIHSFAVPNPRAVLTGGQPGSGKSYIVNSVGVQFEGLGGVIVIDPDAIRPTLPYMKERIAAGNLDIPDAANIDAGTIAYQMVQIAKEQHRNVIIDGTLQNTGRALDLAGELRAASYNVEFHGMAVNPGLSHARTYSRREDQIANSPSGFGRGVGDDFHFQATKGYAATVEAFQTKSAVNSMALYFNDGPKVETKFEGGVWVPAISMKEKLDQAHNWPSPEIVAATVETWTVASDAMRARQAPADEQAKVAGFRAAAIAKTAAASPAQQADRFDAACAAESKSIVERATRLEGQLEARREQLRTQTAESIAAKPTGPKWKPGAAKALVAWESHQTALSRATATTNARIERVAPFTQSPIPGYPSRVEEMAVARAQRREPQMAREAMAFRVAERQQQARAFSQARAQQQSVGQKLSR